ncbi:dynein heavy chain 10, axonemal [Pelomyxa schiedti]|nr:dynein heavy chain 10, axonemal [Pelomyxa schiedti]
MRPSKRDEVALETAAIRWATAQLTLCLFGGQTAEPNASNSTNNKTTAVDRREDVVRNDPRLAAYLRGMIMGSPDTTTASSRGRGCAGTQVGTSPCSRRGDFVVVYWKDDCGRRQLAPRRAEGEAHDDIIVKLVSWNGPQGGLWDSSSCQPDEGLMGGTGACSLACVAAYLVKLTDCGIVSELKNFLPGSERMNSTMSEHFGYGSVARYLLPSLLTIVGRTYGPLLSSPQICSQQRNHHPPTELSLTSGVKSNFSFPTVSISNTQPTANKTEVIPKIENCMTQWLSTMHQLLECDETHSAGQGTTFEINFWRRRCRDLKSASTQLNSEAVQTIIKVVKEAGSPLYSSFYTQLDNLSLQSKLAHDNVTLLSPFQRYFSLELGFMTPEVLQGVLATLKVTWTMSSYYHKEENILALIRKVCWDIEEHVKNSLMLPALFQDTEAWNKTSKAKSILEKWRHETQTSLTAWLVAPMDIWTIYMNDVVTSVRLYYATALLSHMSVGIMGETQPIDRIKRHLNTLLAKLGSVTYDVFDKEFCNTWQNDLSHFFAICSQIDEAIANIIDCSFRNLHRAEVAFDLLQTYKTISTRPSIHQQLLTKYPNALECFKAEVEKVRHTFYQHKNNPPIGRNQTPSSGSVIWSQALFEPLKKTVLKMQTAENNSLLCSETGAQTMNIYLTLGKEMRAYEQNLFKKWVSRVDELYRVTFNGHPILAMNDKHPYVHFNTEIASLIHDAKVFQTLGFEIPTSAVNIAINTKNLFKFEETLKLVRNAAGTLQDIVEQIATAVVVKTPTAVSYRVQDFYNQQQQFYKQVVQELVHKYNSMTNILVNIEHIMSPQIPTPTLHCPHIGKYYDLWEARLYNSLTKTCKQHHSTEAFPPLFHTDLSLNPPDIITNPSMEVMAQYLTATINDVIGCPKHFVRYEEESFDLFLMASQKIAGTLLGLKASVQQTLTDISQEISSWSKYQPLWTTDRKTTVQNFFTTHGSLPELDNQLDTYRTLLEEISQLPLVIEIGFVSIAVEPLSTCIKAEVTSWILAYGNTSHQAATDDLHAFSDTMTSMEQQIPRSPATSLEELKGVLSVLENIRGQTISIESRYNTILHQYKILTQYHIPVPEEESSLVKQIEQFQVKLQHLTLKYQKSGPTNVELTLDSAVTCLNKFKQIAKKYCAIRDNLIQAEKLLNLPITIYPDLIALQDSLSSLDTVFQLYTSFKDCRANWLSIPWSKVDIDVLVGGIDGFINKTNRLPKPLQSIYPSKLLITGYLFLHTNDEFTLGTVLSLDLEQFTERISDVVETANHEDSFGKTLQSISTSWKTMQFELIKLTNGEKTNLLLKGIDDIQSLIEDNQMTLQAMAVSRYASSFLEKIQKWEKQLALVEEVTQEWMIVQKKWLYLENIFLSNEDIRERLPVESEQFSYIDKTFKTMMSEIGSNTLVLQACQDSGRAELLKNLHVSLQTCQCALSEYLETKRQAFSRFYFISDDELLAILGSSDLSALQTHMIQLFGNIQTLVVNSTQQSKIVAGMISSECEQVKFRRQFPLGGPVEVWMQSVESEMKYTLRALTKETVFYHATMPFSSWIGSFPAMSILVAAQIWWTWNTEDTFHQLSSDKNAFKKLSNRMHDHLQFLVGLVRQDLPPITRSIINSLIIIGVHQEDVVESLVRGSIFSLSQFEWESQLRFYWDTSVEDVVIQQCSGVFHYGYEYLGLSGRLVITPLTERCILTLTQAHTHKLGGAPAGPAGTGKTETVKDLAKSLGLLCKVYNCGEGVDYSTTARLLSGLVQCGGWACFDEFNRIKPEVLSVISIQVSTIQQALRASQTKFQFFGKELNLDSKCGIFVTSNPTYSGRTELPDNLKALFRPVVMAVPDMELIAEVMLFSFGFSSARTLAKKICALYELAKQQLTKQKHYDWGLRALKSALMMAGNLKRGCPSQEEDVVMIKAIRGMNLPKFVFSDISIFQGILNDIFPGVTQVVELQKTFREHVEDVLKEKNYQVVPEQVNKVVQLYETLMARHCVMVVGPTLSGKTVIIETLQSALAAIGSPTKLFVLNPKAQSVKELYGWMDPNTRQWNNGILSSLFRKANAPQKKEKKTLKYIVLDGDVDPKWVEDMNSVMDDSKQLTLPNGECIRMQPHCALIFEVTNLEFASPATVSRCGMVYVSAQNLGFRPFFFKWIKEKSSHEQKGLTVLFEKYVPRMMNFIFDGDQGDGTPSQRLQFCISVCPLYFVKQLCAQLDTVLCQRDISEDLIDLGVLETQFIFCMTWSFGSTLLEGSRESFDKFLKTLSGLPVISTGDSGVGSLPGALPTLFEYSFSERERQWVPWATKVAPLSVAPSTKFHQVLVPTSDTVRYTWILKSCIEVIKKPILFVGVSGTAKTAIVQAFLEKLNTEEYTTLYLNMSSKTSSFTLQQALEDNTERCGAGLYQPPAGRTLIICLEDLNMPSVDQYGTQQPMALLRLLLERGGLYDWTGDLAWKKFRKVQFVATMGMPGGGRVSIDSRLLSLFNVFYVSSPSRTNLKLIYWSILREHLASFSPSIKEASGTLTDITLTLFNYICQSLPPTPSKFHYTFNLRDLSRLFEGLCLSKCDKVDTVGQMIRLWRNECLRVFCDRMVSSTDTNLVLLKIHELLQQFFPQHLSYAIAEPSLFGDFSYRTTFQIDTLNYEDIGTFASAKEQLEETITFYREQCCHTGRSNVNLVLNHYTIEHIARILRIIQRPRSHAFLIGLPGSGKRTLARIAAFSTGFAVFEPTLTRNYGDDQFHETLKDLYRQLGLENKPTVFLFTDEHLIKESFLEAINNILTCGLVPSLFADDEKEHIAQEMREEVARNKVLSNRENCWTLFTERCRDNLHVILCMSPASESLHMHCQSFPGLISNTCINWFHPWPNEALRSVALANTDLGFNAELQHSIVDHMVFVHLDALKHSEQYEHQMRRPIYITPNNFIDFLNIYKDKVKETYKYIDDQTKRLETGLKKLTEAGSQVEILNSQLELQKTQIDTQTEVCNKLLIHIAEKKTSVKEAQELSKQKEIELQDLAQQISVKMDEATQELQVVQPELDQAHTYLRNLRREEITEIRSFPTPPMPVQSLCECICWLKGVKVSWKSARALMASPNFLHDLIAINADTLTDKQVKGVSDILRKSDLSVKMMQSISSAAVGLLTWVEAILHYTNVAKKVKPKQIAVRKAQDLQQQNKQDLEEIVFKMKSLVSQLEALDKDYQQKTAEQKSLKEQAEVMERRLSAAKQLISGFRSEQSRWTTDLSLLSQKRPLVAGDCLLAASFLSYTAPFNFEYRMKMIFTVWKSDLLNRHIPISSPFKLETVLSNEVQVHEWLTQDLPPDDLSIQNAIFTVSSYHVPLCIDPQMQANQWIKKKEAKEKLIVRTFDDTDFTRQLELAISLGLPMLIEDIDETIDPILNPVLSKNIKSTGTHKVINLCGKEIQWNDKFRLYMTSKLTNPKFSPNIFVKLLVINFNVTQQGLQDQLLSLVVSHEHPTLETERANLMRLKHESEIHLKQCEDTLLSELSSSEGLILDNEDLIQTLERTKRKAQDISEKLVSAQETSEKLENSREQYLPVAKRGSVLFFVVSTLSFVNPMYEYSLRAFLEIYKSSLNQSGKLLPPSGVAAIEKETNLQQRLEGIVSTLTGQVYTWTCMSLFEKDKLTFAFQICIGILKGEGLIEQPLLDFFLRGNPNLGSGAGKPFIWLSDQIYRDLFYLSTLSNDFRDIVQQIQKDESGWKLWLGLERPEDSCPPFSIGTLSLEDIPHKYQFYMLLLVRTFRIDRVWFVMRNFIVTELGEKFVQPPATSFQFIFTQSSPTTPVICVLSPGSDPLSDIFKLGESLGLSSKVKPFALGQDQGNPAAKLLEIAISQGNWVVLQNCHLLPSWLPVLNKILAKLEHPHENFRLWLTTEPTPSFPIGILQRSLKVVTEPPSGLSLNMRNLFYKLTPEAKLCPHPQYLQLVYVLAFFHSVVQERQKYGSIGWNLHYDFNESDFNVSCSVMSSQLSQVHLARKKSVPWEALHYLIGDVVYGGRVTDSYDRRVLKTYLEEYMGDFLFDSFQPFHFFSTGGEAYSLPTGDFSALMESISSLSLVTSPSVVGLHQNADLAYHKNAVKQMWSSLLEMQPRLGGATHNSDTQETVVKSLLKEIAAEVPKPFDIASIEKALRLGTPTEQGILSPAQVVLLQELEYWNCLITCMKKSLEKLERALAGDQQMDRELEAMFFSLFIGSVPSIWQALAPSTLSSLPDWLVHFKRRHKQYLSWIQAEPKVMWLAGLHVPEAYLTSVLQTTARQMSWPLDQTYLECQVTNIVDPASIRDPPTVGCYIHGLCLEGASWDLVHCCLAFQQKGNPVTDMPVIHIIPTQKRHRHTRGTLQTPVYVNQSRRNKSGEGLVFEANLPTSTHPSIWILQGVCLLLNKV